MIQQIADWVFQQFGVAGVVAVGCVLVVVWVLREFVKLMRTVGSQHGAALRELVTALQRQDGAHKEMLNTQVQHTEVLRTLVVETRSLAQGIHQSDLERSRQLVDLVGRVLTREAGAGGG